MRLMDSPLVHRLGWTLFHTLWQDAAIAVLFAVVLLAMRRSTANARYLAGTIALLALAVTPIVTFLVLKGELVAKGIGAVDPTQMLNRYPLGLASKPTGFTALLERLEPATPQIAGLWLVGFILMALRLLGGLLLVERTRRLATATPDGEWQGRLDALATRLGIRRPVQLMLTDHEEMPSAIGVLKLAVLLPASAISRLSPDQIEALLAHELAHIQRHDYLINLLQSALETALFYHPAVWWISSVIRAERENCCDDLAVQAVGDRVCYARALASLEELRVFSPRLAMTANGGSLMQRIKRILGGPSRVTRSGFAWLPCLALASLVVPFAAYAQTEHQASGTQGDTKSGTAGKSSITSLDHILDNPEAEIWVSGKSYHVKDLTSGQKTELRSRFKRAGITVDTAVQEAQRALAGRSRKVALSTVPGFDWGWDWTDDDNDQIPARSITVTASGTTLAPAAPTALRIMRSDGRNGVTLLSSAAQSDGDDAERLALLGALDAGESRLHSLEIARLSMTSGGQDGVLSGQQESLQKQMDELREQLKQLREEMHQAVRHGDKQRWGAAAEGGSVPRHLSIKLHSDATAKQLAEQSKTFQFEKGAFKIDAEQQQRIAEEMAKHAQEFTKAAESFRNDAMAKQLAEQSKAFEFRRSEFKITSDEQKRFAEQMAKNAREFPEAMKGFTAWGGQAPAAPEPPSPPSQILHVDGDQITVKKLPNGKLEIKVWKNGKAKTFRVAGNATWKSGPHSKATRIMIVKEPPAKAPVAVPSPPSAPELPAPAAPPEPE